MLIVLSRQALQHRDTVRSLSQRGDGTRHRGVTVIEAAPNRPARPASWLCGEYGGVQVWAVAGDARVRVAVLIGAASPVVLVNQLLIETPAEFGALAWALAVIAAGQDGFHVWRN